MGRTVENLARNFREAWNESDRGKKILENIRDITKKIVENIKEASDKTVEWADELDFGPLLESFEKYTKSLIPLADALSGILSDFYTKVLLPLGTWTIEKGLPELLDVLTKFNEKVDWESLRKNLAEFWDHLEPFAETVGEGLILFIERVSDALAGFLNSQEFKDFLVTVENWMDSVTPEDVADALELVAKSLITLKLALLGYSAIKGIVGIFSTINSFLAIFGIGGSAATAASTMDTVATAATGLSTALSGLAATAVVVGSYKLLTGHLEELFGAFGRSTDQGKRLEERYEGLDGAARFAKDGIDTLKNGIEGYGFAADNCVGTGVALEKAMEDIQNGAILTDQHMAELQKRFSLTDEDMEMLRQEMLDCNPLLREIADNLGFEDASPETLQDIAEGFAQIANDAKPLPEELSQMTDEARGFLERVMEGDTPMEVYGEKLENIGTTADNTCESLNKTGEQISDGTSRLKNETSSAFDSMDSKIAGTTGSMRDKLGRLVDKLKEVAGAVKDFLKSGYENVSGFFSGSSSSQSYSVMPRAMRLAQSIQTPSAPYVHPAIAKLANIEIPGYATGQVIPTSMKRHLAWIGDNPRETEVVSPLSTIKQAQKESLLEVLSELGLTGGGIGNDRPIIIKQFLDSQQVTESVIRNGKMQQMSTGNNPFLLGTI